MPTAIIGEVYHSPEFTFPDGETGNKLLVILGQTKSDDFIVLRTTSQSRLRSWTPGCQNGDIEPGFHIPINTSIFSQDTWICLDYEMLLEIDDFNKCIGKTHHLIGTLEPSLLCALIRCASSAEFRRISITALQDLVASLGCP